METKHTPGPWRWEINLKYKDIRLCGGKPQFDKTVLDFERWGMQSATVRFQEDRNKGHNLANATKFKELVVGREHHADWFQTLNQPDANLIAAAPDLLEAAIMIVEGKSSSIVSAGIEKLRQAVNQATR